jgi:hypothetical protein
MSIDEVFKTLHKLVKSKCGCGNKNFLAPIFHEDACAYKPIAEKMLSESEE